MHLYLIRHAQSANNDLYTRTGGSDGRHTDPPLTELGHRQARLLARFLAARPGAPTGDASHYTREIARHDRRGFGLTHLYCSLMTRAVQTGSYVAEATGLPLAGWTEVHERGGLHNIDEATGEDVGLPGPNRAWFAAEYPALLLPDDLGEAGWWNNKPPEIIAEAVPRARIVWSQLLERHGGTEDRVAVICHAGFFQSLMTALFSDEEALSAPSLGATLMGFGMSNASVSRFEIGDGLIVARYINRVDHLPDELITG